MVGCIYKITNLVNNKVYIGQTITTLKERWRKHCSDAFNKKNVTGVDAAIKKYGKENFSCEEICRCNQEELNKLEQFYIQQYNSYNGANEDIGYNLTLGGQGSNLYNFDEEELCNLWLQGYSYTDIAKKYGCTSKTIGNHIKKYDLDKNIHDKNCALTHTRPISDTWKENFKKGRRFQEGDGAKKVHLIELDLYFNSEKECVQWLISNNYSQASTIELGRKSLSRCLNGDRKTYCKFHFEFA